MQHVAREDRHHRDVGEAKHAENRGQDHQRAEPTIAVEKRQDLAKSAPGRCRLHGADNRGEAHHQEPDDHRDVTQAVQEVAPRDAERTDQEARDRRADHACAVEHR